MALHIKRRCISTKCIENVDQNSCSVPTKDDLTNISNVFGQSFQNYPLFQRTIPNKTHRHKKISDIHKVLTCYAIKNGKVYTTAHNESVLLTTIQNGAQIKNMDMLKCGALKIPLTLGQSFLSKNKPYENAMNEMHQQIMPQRHVYLWAIATNTQEQGKGHATKLIVRAIDDAKKQNLPVYLETSDPNNVKIYRKCKRKPSTLVDG